MNFLIYLFIALIPLTTNILIVKLSDNIPQLDVIRLFLLILLPASIVSILLFKKKLSIDKIFIWGSVFFLAASFIAFIDSNGQNVLHVLTIYFDVYATPLLVYFILNNATNLDRKKFVYSILISGIVAALMGIAEMIAGHNIFGPANVLSNDRGLFRANGPYYDVIGFSSIMLLYLPFTFYYYTKGTINRLVAFVCFALFTVGGICAFSRACAFALLLILSVMIFRMRFVNIFLVFYLLVSSLCFFYFYNERIMSSKIVTARLQDKYSYKHRLSQYPLAFKETMSSPWTGIGYGNFKQKYVLDIHNSFLKVLTESGIIVFISFCYFIFYLLIRNFHLYNPLYLNKTILCYALVVMVIANTINLLGNKDFNLLLLIIMYLLNNEEVIKVNNYNQMEHNTTPSF